MKNLWDSIYLKKSYNFSSPLDQLDPLFKLITKKGSCRVLDLGCGTGNHAIELAEHKFEIFGIDISSQAIRLARKLTKERKLQIDFRVSSMCELPFSDNFFDAIVSFRVLNHGKLRDIKVSIDEIYRVLKPGGILYFSVQKNFGKKKKTGISLYNKMPVRIIAPYTYYPLDGKEKGIIHYSFTTKSLKELLSNYKDISIQEVKGKENWERYFFVLAYKSG